MRAPTRKESHIEQPQFTPIVITGGAALAILIVLSRTKPKPGQSPENTPLTDESLTGHFIAAIPEITPELNLELATATQVETFTQTSSSILFGLVDLGTSTVQIRVPVTYRYHLCLRETWRLEIRGQRIMVHAPVFKPSLPPAIHTDRLETLAVRGWARGATTGLEERCRQAITPTLARHATEPRHLDLVRPQCRQSVAEFVRLWLEREGRWGPQGFTEIQVVFPEEEALPPPATLSIQ